MFLEWGICPKGWTLNQWTLSQNETLHTVITSLSDCLENCLDKLECRKVVNKGINKGVKLVLLRMWQKSCILKVRKVVRKRTWERGKP